jgi:hexosaminidase
VWQGFAGYDRAVTRRLPPCGWVVVFLLVAGAPGAAAEVNARPPTIPAIRHWTGARGSLRLLARPVIFVPSRCWRALRPTARTFAGDLAALLKRPVEVAHYSGPPLAGEIVLELGAGDPRLGSEGYELAIGPVARVAARTAAGAFYGTRTLLQLLDHRRALPDGTAVDWPRYPDRGLMIDLGRRVYPAAWIEAEIRQLAYLKLNVLHLHLTDDQRWGIESDTHPELVSPGALTKRQVRQILAVARRYHVTVVPEIDMPAHVGTVLAKHPDLELKAATIMSPPQTPDSRKLDISNPAALRMVRQLLDEYLPLFGGPYWDVGGDEYLTPGEQLLYPQLLTYARSQYGPNATVKDAILGFFNRVDAIVRAHHKTLWAWHDELGGGTAIAANADIQASWWIDFSPLSEPRPPTPQQLIAEGHDVLNDGWFPTYYTEDLGPIEGKPSMQNAYEMWEVNQFCSPTENGQFLEPCYVVSSNEPRNLGSTINAWDDHELTLGQLRAGLAAPLMVLAQKTWHSPELTPSYTAFRRVMTRVGGAPR